MALEPEETTEDSLWATFMATRPGISRAPSMDQTVVSDKVAGENDPFPWDEQSLDLFDGEVLESEIGSIDVAPSVNGGDSNSNMEVQSVMLPNEEANSMEAAVPDNNKTSEATRTGTTTRRKRPRQKSRSNKNRSTTLEPDILERVDEPTHLDVLLGRGGKSNHWQGNKRYRREVKKLQPRYIHAPTKDAKTQISELVISTVQGYGGRFLKRMNRGGGWYVVPHLVARRKASQALREM